MLKKKREEEVETQQTDFNEVNQDDISDDEMSQIRETLEVEEGPGEANKKFVTGFRPNPPPKRSWWDKAEKKYLGGQKLVPINWKGNLNNICKVCSPGVDVNTYLVKFYDSRDETCINSNEYMLAPDNTPFMPYRDAYEKWKMQQKKASAVPTKTP